MNIATANADTVSTRAFTASAPRTLAGCRRRRRRPGLDQSGRALHHGLGEYRDGSDRRGRPGRTHPSSRTRLGGTGTVAATLAQGHGLCARVCGVGARRRGCRHRAAVHPAALHGGSLRDRLRRPHRLDDRHSAADRDPRGTRVTAAAAGHPVARLRGAWCLRCRFAALRAVAHRLVAGTHDRAIAVSPGSSAAG